MIVCQSNIPLLTLSQLLATNAALYFLSLPSSFTLLLSTSTFPQIALIPHLVASTISLFIASHSLTKLSFSHSSPSK